MEDKNKAVRIIKKAKEDFSVGKISRREFNSLMMTFGAIAGYTLFNSFANAWTGTRMRKSSGVLGYQIPRSLRFRASANAYLSRTPGSASNQTTFTFSTWFKRGQLSLQYLFQVGGDPGGTVLYLGSDNCLHLTLSIQAAETFVTNQVFRDPSAWYHLFLVVDTTQATSSNRVKIYINGSQITSFSGVNYPTQNATVSVNSTAGHTLGYSPVHGTGYFDGYLSEVNFVDGQALPPASFGQVDATTGAWSAKRYAGTYGTNGFYLPFTNTSSTTNLVKDSSGNTNHWTPNNISLTAGATYDSMTDVPLTYGTTDRGNYCVLNPNAKFLTTITTSNGNLTAVKTSASDQARIMGSIGVSSDKWYWEVTPTAGPSASGNHYLLIGISGGNNVVNPDPDRIGYIASNDGAYAGYKQLATNGSITNSAYGANYTTNDVIGIALDCSANTITFYKNNVSQGTITSIQSRTWFPMFVTDGTSNSVTLQFNFGQRPFAYTPPTGFKSLHTGNFATPTVIKPKKYFDVAAYTGNATVRSISTDGNGNTLEIAPDLVWTKARSGAANNHVLFDSSRGVGNYLMSSSTSAEVYNAGMLTAFNANGFSVGTDTTTAINGSGLSLVAWMWKAGGTTSSNTNGTVTSQVSANVASGFSIVSYALPSSGVVTIGHGLNAIPKMIITKKRDSAENWNVWFTGFTVNEFLYLNSTGAKASTAAPWGAAVPTSTVFGTTVGQLTSGTPNNQIAYCFAEIDGYSKIGSYVGNGSTDGPFIYCGFKSRYFLIKNSTQGYDWYIHDSERNTYNPVNNELYPHATSAEVTSSRLIDITSNGLKIRDSNAGINNSGDIYVLYAVAEAPFKYASAR